MNAASNRNGYALPFEFLVPSFLRAHAYFFWASVSLSLIGVSMLLANYVDNRKAFMGLCVLQAAGIMLVPLTFKICFNRLIKDWSQNLANFILDEPDISPRFMSGLTFASNSRPMYYAGCGLAILGVVSLFKYLKDLPFLPLVFGFVLVLCSAFFAGIGLYGIFVWARAIYRLGNFSVLVSKHKFGILSTGRMLLKCYCLIAMTWLPYSISAFWGIPDKDHLFDTLVGPSSILGVPTFVIILRSFVTCQVPLHRKMVEFKKKELFYLDDEIYKLTKQFDSLDELNRENIDFLERRKERVMALPEWPFSLPSSLGVTISSIMPMFINILSSPVVKKFLEVGSHIQ